MGYAPFELNYGYIPQLEQRLHTNTNSKFVGVHQFVEQALWNIMAAHDAIIAAHMMQTYHVNRHRQPGNVCIHTWRQGLPVDKEPGTAQGQGQEIPAQVHWAIQGH